MKRVKPVYFHDRRGFLLTFGPQDEELFRWASGLSSESIREIFAIHSFAEIERAAGREGVREWMRARLRGAMRSAPPESARAFQAPPPRDHGWPERDLAVAPRALRLVETYAPDSSRVLDPFAGPGLYPMLAAQRGADAFWCEISPVQRFLAVTRFRALYREDAERRQLADELENVADSLQQQMARAGGGAEGGGAMLSSLRWLADRGAWTDSGTARALFRAAVVSLLADGEPLDAQVIANELRRHARYITSRAPMRTFPTLLADDARDLHGMRSAAADLLLTTPPFLGSPEAFPAAAEEFLSMDMAAERPRAVGSTASVVPRGRGTALHRAHELRALEGLAGSGQLARVIDPLVAIVNGIDEPGKAAMAANYFAGLIQTSTAVERHLVSNAVAIVEVPDSWFGGQLIRNADIVRDLLGSFGFDEVASESKPVRVMTADGVRKEDRVIVMRRGPRASAARAGWAAWA